MGLPEGSYPNSPLILVVSPTERHKVLRDVITPSPTSLEMAGVTRPFTAHLTALELVEGKEGTVYDT